MKLLEKNELRSLPPENYLHKMIYQESHYGNYANFKEPLNNLIYE